jgi:hypothetical protein
MEKAMSDFLDMPTAVIVEPDKKIYRSDHFSLDLAPLLCHGTIAEGQWYAYSKKTTPVLRSRVYGTRAGPDPRGRGHLRGDKLHGVGSYGMRVARLEKSQWPVEGHRMPGTVDAVGQAGDFGASSQKVVGLCQIQKEHFAGWTGRLLQRTYR